MPVIAILAMLCTGQIFAGRFFNDAGRSYNEERNIEVRHPDWMKWLPDEISLAALSIPGTHDTMADCSNDCRDNETGIVITTPVTQTQGLSLSEQLLAGIRALDIRVNRRGDKFRIHHGDIDLGYWFGSWSPYF